MADSFQQKLGFEGAEDIIAKLKASAPSRGTGTEGRVPEVSPTPKMIEAGLKEWFADAWAETEEDRLARVYLAMERCRPK